MKSNTPPEFRDALTRWGLAADKGYSLEPLGGYGINSANFRVVGPGGEAAGHLKVIARPDATTGAKLDAWHCCGRSGVRVAELQPASDGRPAVECGGRLLVMFGWCDGQPFADRPAQREAAGRELARLEAALAAVETTVPRSERYRPLSTDEARAIRAACRPTDEFERKVLAEIDRLCELSAEIERRAAGDETLQHVDYHPANVLFDGDEVAAILDFESLATERRGQGLALAASRFGRDVEGMIEFVGGYAAAGGAASGDLLRRLPALAVREAIGRINYILRSAMLEADRAWCFDVDKHLATIERMAAIEGEFAERVAALDGRGNER